MRDPIIILHQLQTDGWKLNNFSGILLRFSYLEFPKRVKLRKSKRNNIKEYQDICCCNVSLLTLSLPTCFEDDDTATTMLLIVAKRKYYRFRTLITIEPQWHDTLFGEVTFCWETIYDHHVWIYKEQKERKEY